MFNRFFLYLCFILLGAILLGPVRAQMTTPGAPVTAGLAQQVADTLIVDASAYALNDAVGEFRQLTVALYNGQTGFITNFRVISISGQAATIVPYIFDASPTGTRCSNNSAFSMAAADVDKLLASPSSVSLVSPTGMTPSVGSIDFLPPRPFVAGGSFTPTAKTIWYCLIAGSVFAPGTTSDIHTRTGIILN